ncbi:Leucine-rich repeat and immunoglobulin-like domain-containing nogo receptor-interacting protein 1, partial [Acropora cervicornis]
NATLLPFSSPTPTTFQRPTATTTPGGFTYFQNCSSGETDCHARLSSPLISSGAKWKCLQFWYYTTYANQLKVLLVPNETTSHLLKTYDCDRSYRWRLRRVPLSANFAYQVVFEGSPRGFYGADFLVAVKNVVFLTDECIERPSRLLQDICSRNSSESDTSRYIYSPIYYYYPLYNYGHYYYFGYGFYEGCNWTISAPYGNIIKLRFIEFQLEEHPSCSSDYIEVYDGYYGEFKLLGRYCGQRYPSFLKSSSNVLKILFSDESRISVFKFFFSSEKHCPSSCVCFPVSSKSRDMVVTVEEGKEVIYIPKTFPTNTTVMDLSRNHIFRVEDGAFYSTVALETLKLDMNFITTLPHSTFGKLENLQTLSLKSNRISKIEKNAFNYSRNLIYLYLQENTLELLPNEGFNGLSRLKILDISNNRIKRIFSKTFAGLSSLEIL